MRHATPRSEFDFDVISGPATPRPPRSAEPAPTTPRPGQGTPSQPASGAGAPAK